MTDFALCTPTNQNLADAFQGFCLFVIFPKTATFLSNICDPTSRNELDCYLVIFGVQPISQRGCHAIEFGFQLNQFIHQKKILLTVVLLNFSPVRIPPPTLLRRMDTGSLTCAQIWVKAVHMQGVQAQIGLCKSLGLCKS